MPYRWLAFGGVYGKLTWRCSGNHQHSTIPIWVTTNISTRGNFLAKLSAASVLASIPVVLAGWIAQKRMIRGLAMGAIK